MFIKIDINCPKIPKSKLKDGKYLKAVLQDTKGGRDQYGNDGFITMDTTAEERQAGVRGEIIGNWRDLSKKDSQPARQEARQRPSGAPQGSRQRKPPVDPDLDVADEDDGGVPF